jgi:hypothetical protein
MVVADVDEDGDLDMISASTLDFVGEIFWYENTDGKGEFGEKQVITTLDFDADFLATADVDGDGDLDVLAISEYEGKIVWYENTDGRGKFGEQQVISTVSKWARFLTTADLDGDGDLDVLSAFLFESRIAWYEQRLVGDANDDGVFNSSDLVLVFQSGEYEDRAVNNSSFVEGDWNGDGEFDSGDLVLAFQTGRYSATANPSTTSFAAAADWLFAQGHRENRVGALLANGSSAIANAGMQRPIDGKRCEL